MNGRKAKALMKIARERTQGKPYSRLMAQQRNITIGYNEDGSPKGVVRVQVINDAESTRGVYLALKRGKIT